MDKHYYGENGFTYNLFSLLKRGQIRELLNKGRCADAEGSFVRDVYDIGHVEDVYFFPSFGRRDGFGEPDVIIVTEEKVFLVEVEIQAKLGDILKKVKQLSNEFDAYKRTPLRQLERFYAIAHALGEKNFVDQSGKQTSNPHRLLFGAYLLDPQVIGSKVVRACGLEGRPYIRQIADALQSRDPIVTLLTMNYANNGEGWADNQEFHQSVDLILERARKSWKNVTAKQIAPKNHGKLKKLYARGLQQVQAYVEGRHEFLEKMKPQEWSQQFTRIYTGQDFSIDLRDDIDEAKERAII